MAEWSSKWFDARASEKVAKISQHLLEKLQEKKSFSEAVISDE